MNARKMKMDFCTWSMRRRRHSAESATLYETDRRCLYNSYGLNSCSGSFIVSVNCQRQMCHVTLSLKRLVEDCNFSCCQEMEFQFCSDEMLVYNAVVEDRFNTFEAW